MEKTSGEDGECILLALISEEKKHEEDFTTTWEITHEAEMVAVDLGAGRPWYQVIVSRFGGKEAKLSPLVYNPHDARDEWEIATGFKCRVSAKELKKRAVEAVAA